MFWDILNAPKQHYQHQLWRKYAKKRLNYTSPVATQECLFTDRCVISY